ncbi:MAG: chloride channel protein [Candidatus Heimdallarchaeota archaeon]
MNEFKMRVEKTEKLRHKLRQKAYYEFMRKWTGLGIIIGVIAGIGAILFFELINISLWLFFKVIIGYSMPQSEQISDLSDPERPYLIPVVLVFGGLLSGFLVVRFAPEAEGHGTDAAIKAFHHEGGRIRARVPLVKTLASAITIGSGGSAGREGPTAQISAGFGSFIANALNLSEKDRRIAVCAGIGAGIGTIFKSPLGGAILSLEILYQRDFEAEAFIPSFISSIVGYAIFGSIYGWDPVFATPFAVFENAAQLFLFAILGIVCAAFGRLYVFVFYKTKQIFDQLKISPYFKPAIGGLLVGLLALVFPEVLAMGYGWITLLMNGKTTGWLPHSWYYAVLLLFVISGAKILSTSLSIGSGGSGGVFAPGLVVGAFLGGALGLLFIEMSHYGWVPDIIQNENAFLACFVIVGMMALFGATAKAPVAVIFMVMEMTNAQLELLLPAMLTTMLAYLLMGEITIYDQQVPTKADSPAHSHEYHIDPLRSIRAGDVMESPNILAPITSVMSAYESIRTTDHPVIVMEENKVVGIVTHHDILKSFLTENHNNVQLSEIMSKNIVTISPSTPLSTAAEILVENQFSVIPITDKITGALLGVLRDVNILWAYCSECHYFFGDSVPRAGDDFLAHVRVRDIMTRVDKVVRIKPETTISTFLFLVEETRHTHFPVLDKEKLLGIIDLSDVIGIKKEEQSQVTVGERIGKPLVMVYPEETMWMVLRKMTENELGMLPVVKRSSHEPYQLVGIVSRGDVLRAHELEEFRESAI